MRVLHYVIETLVIVQCVAFAGWHQTRFPWVRFASAQVFQIEAMVAGWLALIPFCLFREWETSSIPSIKDGRVVDQWTWGPANLVFGNPEDGVSGIFALVNGNQPYMPGANPAWRAYCWSALRNSCDNLKYVFAVKEGPLIEKPYRLLWIWPMAIKAGYQMENGFNVPVFSPIKARA